MGEIDVPTLECFVISMPIAVTLGVHAAKGQGIWIDRLLMGWSSTCTRFPKRKIVLSKKRLASSNGRQHASAFLKYNFCY